MLDDNMWFYFLLNDYKEVLMLCKLVILIGRKKYLLLFFGNKIVIKF